MDKGTSHESLPQIPSYQNPGVYSLTEKAKLSSH